MTDVDPTLRRIRDTLAGGQRFLLTSHARPDGDSLGSQLALAGALDQLGKAVRIVNSDPAPALYAFLPGLSRIEVAPSVDPDDLDAVVVLECGTLDRTGVTGLEGQRLINIDHHIGNAMYGDINWHDASACACAELVVELIDALGARMTPAIATHLYVAILTDTGSFRHANITARTFATCQRIADTGVNPAEIAAEVFNNGSLGRLRLTGTLLDQMTLEDEHRIAVLSLNPSMLEAARCDPDDLEGMVNLPLAAKQIRAVVFLRDTADGLRVSLRSKDQIDIRQVAVSFGGGGHLNAAGLTLEDRSDAAQRDLLQRVSAAITAADGPRRSDP
jgi:phosphoesterase RecJ-like protein